MPTCALPKSAGELGLVDDERWQAFESKRDAVELERERLKSTWLNTKLLSDDDMQALFGQKLERDYTFEELLRRPGCALSGPDFHCPVRVLVCQTATLPSRSRFKSNIRVTSSASAMR